MEKTMTKGAGGVYDTLMENDELIHRDSRTYIKEVEKLKVEVKKEVAKNERFADFFRTYINEV